MEALDTNVLVRYFVQDGGDQADAAERIVDAATRGGRQLFVGDVVVVETVWVLERFYRFSRAQIVGALDELFDMAVFAFESRRRLGLALVRFQAGPAGFADYLILEVALEHGADRVASFDRAFGRSDEVFTP